MNVQLMPVLPKITDELLDRFIHMDFFYLDSDGEWQWSNLAIDFADRIIFIQDN